MRSVTEGQRGDVDLGQCATCGHARQVESARGSRFTLCRRAAADPSFARYPHLPVRDCRGFEPERSEGA